MTVIEWLLDSDPAIRWQVAISSDAGFAEVSRPSERRLVMQIDF